MPPVTPLATPPGTGTLLGVGALPRVGPMAGVGASRGLLDERPSAEDPSAEDMAEQGIWLCGGGELPAPLLAALTGRTPWAPPAPAHDPAHGVLDGLAPGPELAMFLADAARGAQLAEEPSGPAGPSGARAAGCGLGTASGGLAGLDDAALTGVLRGWRRLSSWVAAMEHAAAAELAARRIAEAETAGCWAEEAGRYAAAEIAAALTLTRTSAEILLGHALVLQDLPATAAALAAGRIDLPRAAIIADAVAYLEQGLRMAVDAELAAAAAMITTGQLRAAAAKAVIAAYPAAAEERRRQAEKQARVEHRPEASGVTAMLAGRDLPAAESAAAANRITALAAALKHDGATGGIDLLRAQVFLGLLLGRPVAAPAPQPGSATCPSAEPVTGPSAAPDTGRAPRGASSAASVNLNVPLTTWLGLAEAPGDLTGYGPITAATARHMLATAAGDADTRWCLTITGDDDRVVAHGCATMQRPRPRTEKTRALKGKAPPAQHQPTAGAPAVSGWNLTITAQPLATSTCGHSRETAAYTPPRPLRHLIEIRDRTCTFPGCRRAAISCDKDHTIPYDRDGRTCECNLAPLCRFHHKVKQAAGWRLEQPTPGVFIWTTPSGWRYTKAPTFYDDPVNEPIDIRR